MPLSTIPIIKIARLFIMHLQVEVKISSIIYQKKMQKLFPIILETHHYIWLVHRIDHSQCIFIFQAAENGHQRVCAIFIERGCCSLSAVNIQQLTAADLAENAGYPSLANELRLRADSLIKLEKASVVRLVIKKRNVPRSDASNQVNEEDFIVKKYSTTKLNNQRFDFLELENSTNQPLQHQIQ